jgi:hypothetical protein
MFPFSRNFLKFAAAGALVALTAVSTPARAVELVDNLGPVGPHEPILAWVGSKRIIAFYQPDSGNCAVHVVVWDPKDTNAESTMGFQATLNPGGTASIASVENKSLTLRCGDYAEHLAAVDTDRQVASK